MAGLSVLPRPAKSVQNGAGFSRKLEHTGPAEKERVALLPQREQLARTPEPLLPKRTEPSVQITKIVKLEKVKVSESLTLTREKGIKAGVWRGKDGIHSEGRQVPRRRGRASKESLSCGSRRKHERVSGRKSSPG